MNNAIAIRHVAFEDAGAAVEAASSVVKDRDPARRFAAAKLAIETGLPELENGVSGHGLTET